MSEKFTASNGVVISEDERGLTLSTTDWRKGREAMAELFLHERDQELGRWRWPENPDWVVYADSGGNRAYGVNERHPRSFYIWRSDLDSTIYDPDEIEVARAYFAAHPLPKPWHDAKPGEVWLITDDRQKVFEMTCVDGDGGLEFFTHHRRHSTRYTGITAGRMIWPEVVES